MPGFITHYICGQAALRAVPPEIMEMVAPHTPLFNLGTQGPDIFFYYFPGFLKKHMRNMGSKMHSHGFALCLGHMANLLTKIPKFAHGPLFSYICGCLTHYALDSAAHPYVYAKTGKKGVRRIDALRASVKHRKFETAIDVLMLDLLCSKKPCDHKLWQLINVAGTGGRVAAAGLAAGIQKTYALPVTPRDAYKAMMHMVHITRVIQSRTGRRKRFMELVETLTVGEHLFSSIVHMQRVRDGVDYMNMQKQPWANAHCETFPELYDAAVADAAQMLETLWRFTKGEVSRAQLAAVLGDRDLHTGLAARG